WFWRQPWLAVSASVVLWRRRGLAGWQDSCDRLGRDGAGDRFRPEVFPADDAGGCAWLDRCQQQQGIDKRADLMHEQRRKHPVVRQEAVPRHRQGDAAVAEPAGTEGALSHPRAVEPRDLQLLAEPAGSEGLPGLVDGSEAGRTLVYGGRELLCAV